MTRSSARSTNAATPACSAPTTGPTPTSCHHRWRSWRWSSRSRATARCATSSRTTSVIPRRTGTPRPAREHRQVDRTRAHAVRPTSVRNLRSHAVHTLMVLYPVPDDPAAFKSYYADKHIPLAATLPGLRAHHYGYPEAMGPGPRSSVLHLLGDVRRRRGDAGRAGVRDRPEGRCRRAQLLPERGNSGPLRRRIARAVK